MNYSKIVYFDSFNARGLSTVLWVSGCEHHCKNCFNQSTWDFNNGKLFTNKESDNIVESLKHPRVSNFVISGGDPLHPYNIKEITKLCKKIKDNEITVDIIVYTGYLAEELIEREDFKDLMPYIDFIIDGPYIQELATKIIDYRGSTNQRCIGIKKDYSSNSYNLINISDLYFKEEKENNDK